MLHSYLKEMIDAGVDSFKVEGRTKSLYYVSAVAKTYRAAIDEIYENPNADMDKYFEELKKVGNRGYTTGFALSKDQSGQYSYGLSKGLAGADFLFEFHDKKDAYFCQPELVSGSVVYLVKIKNKILKGDEVEIITPSELFRTKILAIYDENGSEIEVGNTNADIYVKLEKEPRDYKYAIARTIGIKEHVS